MNVKGSLGEVCNDWMPACVGCDGGKVESFRVGFGVFLFALFGNPADCESQTVLVGCEEFVASVYEWVCFPLLTTGHANFGLARSGTVFFPTLAYQCDDVPSFLVLLWLLSIIVLRTKHNNVART